VPGPDVKITNDGLTRSGMGSFRAYRCTHSPYGKSGRRRVTSIFIRVLHVTLCWNTILLFIDFTALSFMATSKRS